MTTAFGCNEHVPGQAYGDDNSVPVAPVIAKGTLILTVALSLLIGCGGDDGSGATCGKTQPCGGNAVGNWELVATCQSSASLAAFASAFSVMAMGSNCPTQTVRHIDITPSGSFVLNGESGYSVAFEYRANLDINVPASCLSTWTCAMVGANLQAEIAAGAHPGVVSASCSGSPDCICREVLVVPQSEVGTYTTAGSVITFTATNGDVSSSSYCIEGTTAHFMSVSMGSVGQAIINSDLVGVRQ